ncbi:hypothetical protein ACOJBO_17575 [Rhizobium beringeri]
MDGRQVEPVVAVVSEAVRRWFEFYEVPLDERASDMLCSAAISLYGDGYQTVDDIATKSGQSIRTTTTSFPVRTAPPRSSRSAYSLLANEAAPARQDVHFLRLRS